MSELQLNSPRAADPAMLGAPIHVRKERDFYPTIDANVTRSIARFLLAENLLHKFSEIWECAVGDGAMACVLEDYFPNTVGSDIEPQTPFGDKLDFLKDDPYSSDAIITNPPYGALTTAFIERGLQHIRNNHTSVVAMLARNELDSASTRKHLFGDCPQFYAKLVLTWRPRWIANSTGAPRHNYAWFVWSTKRRVELAGGARIFYTGKRHDSFGADTNCANELPL
jgi:hypothetical protein